MIEDHGSAAPGKGWGGVGGGFSGGSLVCQGTRLHMDLVDESHYARASPR